MRRGGVKSFVDDLVLGRGVVISRAATSLRSVETQPLTRRFVRTRRATSPSTHHSVISEWWWCHWLLSLQVVCSALTVQMIFYFIFFLSCLSFSLFLSFLFVSLCVSLPLLEGNGKTPAWLKLLANSLNGGGGAFSRVPLLSLFQTLSQRFET